MNGWLVLLVFASGCAGSSGSDGLADAATHDAALCPSSYNITITASPSSYRVVAAEATYQVQNASCTQDLPGSTHLATPDTQAEAAELEALVPQVANARYWVGVVQAANQPTTKTGWTLVTGDAALEALWVPAGAIGYQPDDGESTHSVEDNEQNYAQLTVDAPSGFLYDESDTASVSAICECDGKPAIIL